MSLPKRGLSVRARISCAARSAGASHAFLNRANAVRLVKSAHQAELSHRESLLTRLERVLASKSVKHTSRWRANNGFLASKTIWHSPSDVREDTMLNDTEALHQCNVP